MFCGCSSRCYGLVCSVWYLWYFLITLTCFFRFSRHSIKSFHFENPEDMISRNDIPIVQRKESTEQNLTRRQVMWRLMWVCIICICSTTLCFMGYFMQYLDYYFNIYRTIWSLCYLKRRWWHKGGCPWYGVVWFRLTNL